MISPDLAFVIGIDDQLDALPQIGVDHIHPPIRRRITAFCFMVPETAGTWADTRTPPVARLTAK